MSAKASKRGLVYRCMRCDLGAVKKDAMLHFLRKHVPRNEVPVFCAACETRVLDEDGWFEHTMTNRHAKRIQENARMILRQRSSAPTPTTSLFGDAPKEGVDLYRLTTEASRSYWLERAQNQAAKQVKVTTKSALDVLKSRCTSSDQLVALEHIGISLTGGDIVQQALDTAMEWETMEAVASIVCVEAPVIDSSCPSSTRTEVPTEEISASCCPGREEETVKDVDGGRCPGPVLCEVLGKDVTGRHRHTSPVPVACEEETPNYIDGPVDDFDARRPVTIVSAVEDSTCGHHQTHDKDPVHDVLEPGRCTVPVFIEVPVGDITSSRQPVYDVCVDVTEEGKVCPICEDFSELREEHFTPDYDEEMETTPDVTQATQVVPDRTQAEGPLTADKRTGTEPAPAVNVELHLDENWLMPLLAKVMRVSISSIASAITAKTKRDPAPLERALEGVANQVAQTNITLADLAGKMEAHANSQEVKLDALVDATRKMCQKVGPVTESVQEAATSYKDSTAHLQQAVGTFTSATSSLQTKIQVVVGQSTDTQKVIASQLEDQGVAFRHLAANVEGFHEDLRQGGLTSQLVNDIFGVSKQPVMEPEAPKRECHRDMTGFQEMWDAVAEEGCAEVLAPGGQFVLMPKAPTVPESCGNPAADVREPSSPSRKRQPTPSSKPVDAPTVTEPPKDVPPPAEALKPSQGHRRSGGSSNPLKRSRRGPQELVHWSKLPRGQRSGRRRGMRRNWIRDPSELSRRYTSPSPVSSRSPSPVRASISSVVVKPKDPGASHKDLNT